MQGAAAAGACEASAAASADAAAAATDVFLFVSWSARVCGLPPLCAWGVPRQFRALLFLVC